jgi:hypothetical protein
MDYMNGASDHQHEAVLIISAAKCFVPACTCDRWSSQVPHFFVAEAGAYLLNDVCVCACVCAGGGGVEA